MGANGGNSVMKSWSSTAVQTPRRKRVMLVDHLKRVYSELVDDVYFGFDTATSLQLPIMLRTAALTLSLSAGLATSHPYPAAGPTAHVKNGSYVGVHSDAYNQDFFLGVPFAQPPVGNLRYRAPASLNQSWTDVKPATVNSAEVSILSYHYSWP
jgi:hypothetical protein